jgi:cell wall assembly regulator SMI1
MSELILPVLRETKAWLEKKGIQVEIATLGRPATVDDISAFEGSTGLKLLPSTIEFFTKQGNGVWFSWQQSEEVWGQLVIDPLEELEQRYKGWRANVDDFANDPTSMDLCIRDPKHRPQAFSIWNSMKAWVPLVADEEGNGFCLDTSSGKIVLDEHDWFDGFGSLATTNGLVAGSGIPDFIRNWSKFCFRQPSSLWWGDFRKAGRVDWDPAKFDQEFIR